MLMSAYQGLTLSLNQSCRPCEKGLRSGVGEIDRRKRAARRL
jgi:hypothetical protein